MTNPRPPVAWVAVLLATAVLLVLAFILTTPPPPKPAPVRWDDYTRPVIKETP